MAEADGVCATVGTAVVPACSGDVMVAGEHVLSAPCAAEEGTEIAALDTGADNPTAIGVGFELLRLSNLEDDRNVVHQKLVRMREEEEEDDRLLQELEKRRQERKRRRDQYQRLMQDMAEPGDEQETSSNEGTNVPLMLPRSIADAEDVDHAELANLNEESRSGLDAGVVPGSTKLHHKRTTKNIPHTATVDPASTGRKQKVEVGGVTIQVQPPTSDELREAVEVAEDVATRALEVLTSEFTERMDDAIAREVKSAWGLLAETDRSTDASAQALLAMGRAVAACPPAPSHEQLSERVVVAENDVRDVAVWRCQMRAPADNRGKFLASLKEAFGDALEDKNLFSRLMHAHRQVVTKNGEHIPIQQSAGRH